MRKFQFFKAPLLVLWYVVLQAYDMLLLCWFHITTFFIYFHFKSKWPCDNSCLFFGVCVVYSYCVHWISCLLTYALNVHLWSLYYVPFVFRDIGWWKGVITFGCLNESQWKCLNYYASQLQLFEWNQMSLFESIIEWSWM
jgi:hypothetical protein